MRRLTSAVIVVLVIGLNGCRGTPPPPPPPPPATPISGMVAIWVGTDGDTYISCGRTTACEEGNLNFGRHSPLAVAAWDLGRKVPFIHFTLPTLPPGTEVIEAYIELNHNARNEDGRTDDLNLPVGRPTQPWNAMTRTWNSSTDKGTSGAGYNLCLRSQAWSPTRNIAGEIRGKQRYDVTVYWTYPAASPPIEKGFASNNDLSRTATSLGIAPRLLIRAQLPPGTTIMNRRDSTFSPNDDLGRLAPQPVVTMIAEASPGWPAAWNVAGATSPCP